MNKLFDEGVWQEMINNTAHLVYKGEYHGAIVYLDDCIYQLNVKYRIVDMSYRNKLEGIKLLITQLHYAGVPNEQ